MNICISGSKALIDIVFFGENLNDLQKLIVSDFLMKKKFDT